MRLIRNFFTVNGVFGQLVSDDQKFSCFTLEHAYPNNATTPPTYVQKVPKGVYTCQRSRHQLRGMSQPFETFQIMNVPVGVVPSDTPGAKFYSNILFHSGNTNADTDGCVLLGTKRVGVDVLQSREEFNDFMNYLNGIDSFTLTVE